jgi:hypothetical protein
MLYAIIPDMMVDQEISVMVPSLISKSPGNSKMEARGLGVAHLSQKLPPFLSYPHSGHVHISELI